MAKFSIGGCLSAKERAALQTLAEGGKVRAADSGYRRGFGAWAEDNSALFCGLLNEAAIKFEEGNDAKRGGLSGKFIKCRKFDADKAAARIIALRAKQGRAEIDALRAGKLAAEIDAREIKQRFIWLGYRLAEKILGCAVERSLSGNFYRRGEKPLSAEVPEGCRRVTADGVEQVGRGGHWINC